jgi:hypothetical protein
MLYLPGFWGLEGNSSIKWFSFESKIAWPWLLRFHFLWMKLCFHFECSADLISRKSSYFRPYRLLTLICLSFLGQLSRESLYVLKFLTASTNIFHRCRRVWSSQARAYQPTQLSQRQCLYWQKFTSIFSFWTFASRELRQLFLSQPLTAFRNRQTYFQSFLHRILVCQLCQSFYLCRILCTLKFLLPLSSLEGCLRACSHHAISMCCWRSWAPSRLQSSR